MHLVMLDHLIRQEDRPFSDKQIALDGTSRLGGDRDGEMPAIQRGRSPTAVEHQTAISDVLRVISRLGFDLAPVLEDAW